MALAERAGLADPVAEHVTPGGECGVNAHLKVPCLAAGMAAGADSIDDMDMLRHGAMDILFGGVRAPSTLGSHLRSYTWGNVSQLEKRAGSFLRSWPGRRRCCPASSRASPMGSGNPEGAEFSPEAQALEDNAHKVLAEKAQARNSGAVGVPDQQ